ncbi:MAG: response regulator [Pirellulales bacterium]|nr:response regulator [Pirellulales bacterium]
MNILLLSRDLMLTARMEGVARNLGMPVISCADWATAVPALAACRLIVLDLCMPQLDIGEIVAQASRLDPPLPIVSCGPHVHETRLAEAREAGCDLVVSRGQWDREAEKLCARLLQNGLGSQGA